MLIIFYSHDHVFTQSLFTSRPLYYKIVALKRVSHTNHKLTTSKKSQSLTYSHVQTFSTLHDVKNEKRKTVALTFSQRAHTVKLTHTLTHFQGVGGLHIHSYTAVS